MLEARGSAKQKDKAAAKLTPLDFMIEVLRHPSRYPFVARQWAAQQAAPYVHRKMPTAIEGGARPLQVLDATKLAGLSVVELEVLIVALEKITPGEDHVTTDLEDNA